MTRRSTVKLAGLLLAALVVAQPAYALRCGSKVISRGDHAAEVLNHCGEPVLVQSRVIERALFGHFGPAFTSGLREEVWIEEWTYNFGPHKLMRVLQLENGIVVRIRHLGYGYYEH